jgi:YbbR domain-containing protein
LALKDKIFANLGWKLVAILLALVLWFHVATEKTYEKLYPARIQPVGLSHNLEVEQIEPRTAEVSVIASGKQLLQLSLSGGVTAYIDMSLVTRPGEYEYNLNPADLYDIDISEFRSVTIINGNHFKIAVKSRI